MNYQWINSNLCETNGLQTIRSKFECEVAAIYLGLKDTIADEDNTLTRPNGCHYTKNDRLGWNPSGGSTKCGSSDKGRRYSCICAVPGSQRS